MLAIDQSFLELVLHPLGKPPIDPNSKKPIEALAERIEELIDGWDTDRETVIIPTPALAQFLILAHHEASEYLSRISTAPFFKVEPFDERAAVELAAVQIKLGSTASGRRKRGPQEGTWAKVNFDRQIVAVAKVNNVSAIYSDDNGLGKFANQMGIDCIHSWDLPTPQPRQQPFVFVEPAEE